MAVVGDAAAAAEQHSRLFPNQSHFGVGGSERALLGQKEGKWGNSNAAATLLHSPPPPPPPHLTAKIALSLSLSLSLSCKLKLMTALGQWERQNLSPFDR